MPGQVVREHTVKFYKTENIFKLYNPKQFLYAGSFLHLFCDTSIFQGSFIPILQLGVPYIASSLVKPTNFEIGHYMGHHVLTQYV